MRRKVYYYYEGSNDCWLKVENGNRKLVEYDEVPPEAVSESLRPHHFVEIGRKCFRRNDKIEKEADALRLNMYEGEQCH